ncbi:MAG: hypothetical protein QS99_C0013G0027 [archaeon GW2011_AR4]|nr:MAG: hypothetical protein QS99_C0013G0027 [archaeon GW2011_AR4]
MHLHFMYPFIDTFIDTILQFSFTSGLTEVFSSEMGEAEATQPSDLQSSI